jgi:phage terminase large subunit-like protein
MLSLSMAERDPHAKNPPTAEEVRKKVAELERKERELQESDEPKTDGDKMMDELGKHDPAPPPDYDQL